MSEDEIWVVFRGGMFNGWTGVVRPSQSPIQLQANGMGWAMYVLTEEIEHDRRVMRFQVGSD